MISRIVIGSGSPYQLGFLHGQQARAGVRYNVHAFLTHMHTAGYSRDTVLGMSRENADVLKPHWQEQLAGIAEGAHLTYGEVLAYNFYHDLVSPDECTVFFAAGKSSATGETVFAKNSDKVGGESLVGANFFKFKEINVIVCEELKNGHKIVGVTAAGSAGLKMGMNNRCMAGGANIARTEELYEKNLDLTEIRALDRGYLLRLGLEQENILEATKVVSNKIMELPMGTPGNLEFVDAREGYIIEGSYDRLAVKKIVDDVDSRSNRFITLEYLNKKDDVSSICRYWRTQELLQAKKGNVTFQDLVGWSQDHTNGPGPNSICRHGTHCREEVSLSAMVVELNTKEPNKSRFGICLGKPCHAWRHPEGQVFGDLSMTQKDIPEGFVNGEVFKKFYEEGARSE